MAASLLVLHRGPRRWRGAFASEVYAHQSVGVLVADATRTTQGIKATRRQTYITRILLRRNLVKRKPTIMIADDVYIGLRKRIGPRRISQFIESLVQPHVVSTDLDAAYAEMAR